ncbi:MAG TPA: hybrid sensor histidine kinase/response regulator, partial [Alphaproteobacteria bacterium]|nr:hybrid sensor histidine kinase/response regulator [Alphaproteobacteria bacterium]
MASDRAFDFAGRWRAHGGETGRLIAGRDWDGTPLGCIREWPQSLKTAVDLMLSSLQPVYIAWGPGLVSLYNDAYIPIVGAKHPEGLGKPFAELWAEIWDEYRPLVEATT